jgi:hypothetical protein
LLPSVRQRTLNVKLRLPEDLAGYQRCRLGDMGLNRGIVPVSVGYTKDAEDECYAHFRRTGRIIKLLAVQEIWDEEHVQKM